MRRSQKTANPFYFQRIHCRTLQLSSPCFCSDGSQSSCAAAAHSLAAGERVYCSCTGRLTSQFNSFILDFSIEYARNTLALPRCHPATHFNPSTQRQPVGALHLFLCSANDSLYRNTYPRRFACFLAFIFMGDSCLCFLQVPALAACMSPL